MRYYYIFILLLFSLLSVQAQDFERFFADRSLRLDYTFAGDAKSETVALSELSQLPQWAGRRHNLSDMLLDGNGQIVVSDSATNKCIYASSFSTLFQEWQSTPEATKVRKSFENTLLVPFPKNTIKVEVKFRNKQGQYNTVIQHMVNPGDILIKKRGLTNIVPHTFIHQGGPVDKCINVAIMAEGYTKDDMPKFREHARIACQQILSYEPFGKFSERFNFIAVECESTDSGVSVPRVNDWKSTAFGSHFDTFYSDRYLTTTQVYGIHNALAGIPYAHIIILANTDVYGGGGIFNAYTLTTTGHADFKPVVVHEFGHSFAGLADEYFYIGDLFDDTYPKNVEPWEPNITTLTDFAQKWKKALPAHTPVPTPLADKDKYPLGVYEGAGYSPKGIYRGAFDCRMKTNSYKTFCPVCQKAIERLVKYYTE